MRNTLKRLPAYTLLFVIFLAIESCGLGGDPSPSPYPQKSDYTETEIVQITTSIIVDLLGVPQSEVTLDSHLFYDFGADDLDTIEIIMEIESAFNITISDAELERVRTVGDAVAIVKSRF